MEKNITQSWTSFYLFNNYTPNVGIIMKKTKEYHIYKDILYSWTARPINKMIAIDFKVTLNSVQLQWNSQKFILEIDKVIFKWIWKLKWIFKTNLNNIGGIKPPLYWDIMVSEIRQIDNCIKITFRNRTLCIWPLDLWPSWLYKAVRKGMFL